MPTRSAAEAIERSANGSIARTLNRKTSLLRIVPTACGQAADIAADVTPPRRRFSSPCRAIMLRCSEIAHRSRRYVTIDSRSDPTSSRCQISRLRIRLRSLMAQAKDVLCERAKLGWWSQTESNRRPPACKAGALPTELWPPPSGRNQRSWMQAAGDRNS